MNARHFGRLGFDPPAIFWANNFRCDRTSELSAPMQRAILDGTVLGIDASSGLTRVQVGQGELRVSFAKVGAAYPQRVARTLFDLRT